MKILFTTALLLGISMCYSQYNYGLEVEQQDVKIEGKLNLEDGDENIFIGKYTGGNNTNGRTNSFVGSAAGFDNSSGSFNSFLGFAAGYENEIGNFNSFIGSNAGQDNTTGASNSFFGFSSGLNNRTGSNNISIGTGSGPTQMNSDQSYRLYIDSNPPFSEGNDNPLIYGEFDNDLIRINGTLQITETAKLEPQASAPIGCNTQAMGTMYVNTGGDLYFCNGTDWKTVQLN